jgi:hypothetical protein
MPDFAKANAPANGVLLVAATSGKFFLYGGGRGQPDGVSLVVAQAPIGRHVLVGGG